MSWWRGVVVWCGVVMVWCGRGGEEEGGKGGEEEWRCGVVLC